MYFPSIYLKFMTFLWLFAIVFILFNLSLPPTSTMAFTAYAVIATHHLFKRWPHQCLFIRWFEFHGVTELVAFHRFPQPHLPPKIFTNTILLHFWYVICWTLSTLQRRPPGTILDVYIIQDKQKKNHPRLNIILSFCNFHNKLKGFSHPS